MRGELGDDYVEWLKSEFGIGVKDYAVYWFRKAHERLESGGRAGLVATNSISQNRNRGPSLEWIVGSGGVIVNAVSTQDWSGEAAVDVSIVNWLKGQASSYVLDGQKVDGIDASLRSATRSTHGALSIAENENRAFMGPTPGHRGFILSPPEAFALAPENERYSEVVRPFLIGDDIVSTVDQAPTRYTIDFAGWTLEEAMRFPAALAIVRERVLPDWRNARRANNREYWWRFERFRPMMRAALAGLSRYIASNAQGKRILFIWCEQEWCPSNLTNVFALDDDWSMGLLSTAIHHEWARAQSSTLEDRFRYTPTSAFETFPWPQPDDVRREAVAEIARRMIGRRSEICLERQIGLTKLYNEVDEGAYRDLRELHDALDEAVAAAYGWPSSAAHDPQESNRLLLELNRAIAAGEIDYRPFG